ncbi:MAG: hypothetical protein K2X50_08520 [Gammaproteobacteria bacterium]|jgi:hypothetical protein|nr:hypothetical protein [Gammaproteobacteria bacterium]
MNRTTMTIYFFVLSILMAGDVTAMEDPQETRPLLTRSSTAITPSEQKYSLDEYSASFRDDVDRLAKHFENFSAMTPENQQQLLNTWKIATETYLLEMELSNGGLNPRLKISSETTDKLTAINAIYRSHKKRNGCILH